MSTSSGSIVSTLPLPLDASSTTAALLSPYRHRTSRRSASSTITMPRATNSAATLGLDTFEDISLEYITINIPREVSNWKRRQWRIWFAQLINSDSWSAPRYRISTRSLRTQEIILKAVAPSLDDCTEGRPGCMCDKVDTFVRLRRYFVARNFSLRVIRKRTLSERSLVSFTPRNPHIIPVDVEDSSHDDVE